jgi:DNA-binding transcriptional LysR family regulator
MELRQLRYFVAVAEELHFRRAAARLHMSQPPLSNQLRMLEEELGCPLMLRSRRRVELTPAGEAFLADARALLGDLSEAVETARRIHSGRAGRLRISFAGSALLSVVPDVVKRYRAARPDVELQLRERSTEEQLRDLRAGAIDVGLLPLPVDAPDLRAEVLLRERAVAALPAAHPLAALKRVPLHRLAAEPLVLFPRSQAPGLHDRLLSSLTGSDGPPVVAQYAPETQTIVGLVAAEIGVSLVQASVQRLALPGVTYRPVVGAPTIELAALLQPGGESRPARDFVNLARAGARE